MATLIAQDWHGLIVHQEGELELTPGWGYEGIVTGGASSRVHKSSGVDEDSLKDSGTTADIHKIPGADEDIHKHPS